MSRRGWIAILAAVGVGAAILVGILAISGGDSQATAEQNFCSSLGGLQSSVQSLAGLSASSASKSDYQSAVDEVQSNWDSVKSDASDLAGATTDNLDNAWSTFTSAVQNVPSDASVSDALSSIKSSAQTLVSSVKSTLSGPDCS